MAQAPQLPIVQLAQPRIVVLGAGFAGLQVVRSLRHVKAEILLVDRHSYHTFVPLLYQVATAILPPQAIAYPIIEALRGHKNTQFLVTEIREINFTAQQVDTENGSIPYDYLVIATGSQSEFFQVPGAQDYGFPLRNLQHALRFHQHFLQTIERIQREANPQPLEIAIVGGGATGVELAGSLAELGRRPPPWLGGVRVQIYLIQGGASLLPDFAPRLRQYTLKRLQQLGVTVLLNHRVVQVSETRLELMNGCVIETSTVLWAAGVRAALPLMSPPAQTVGRKKLPVDPTLQWQGAENVYVIGDSAWLKQTRGLAPEALQQGRKVAENLQRQLQGKAPKPFHYFNKGRMAIIEAKSAIAEIGPIKLTGWFPWLLWLIIHWFYLPGAWPRGVVLVSWWQTYGRGRRFLSQRLFFHPRD
ncbi:NAD(P)/FAD-dependent oxidoreductase [Candidatus Synechococcus calcipolaris G9]|uniref:NAD(P)/FAD-dependent oxidoreductase n=1 Tax=Candidatus Synechococcus calcipolaris G9 TaxID=1497997 RepID=A0ABT6F267_9SYNE|nr:NAD(P)/FAD-dependent oxidoreductase [Candidatus Synechococcus calcipolaris]MDG2991946.1 NAD(P)/FAD-dependent oxidoreductase [Candidatus Synechococcus calcipolaris G9]